MTVLMLYDAFNTTDMTWCLVRAEPRAVYTPDHSNGDWKGKVETNLQNINSQWWQWGKEIRNQFSQGGESRTRNSLSFIPSTSYQYGTWKREGSVIRTLRSSNSPTVILPTSTFSKGFFYLPTPSSLLIIRLYHAFI